MFDNDAANHTHTPFTITVNSDYAGQRLDNFLFRALKKIPKSLIYKVLRKGVIRVNKKRVKPDYRIQADDIIRLPKLDIAPDSAEKQNAKPNPKSLKLLDKSILYEDANLMVINKPSGIAAHGGSGINFGVIEMMRSTRPQLKNLELVHRLDRDTSGCMILAKKRSVLKELHELLRTGKIKKKYLVLVRGKWQGGKRKVEVPLLKSQLRSGERMVQVNETGKQSLTTFKPQQVFQNTSLLEVELGTGRTHQIRVHAAHIHHPIAGDTKYGDKEFNALMHKQGLKRLFLCAHSVSFYLPSIEKNITVTAPLDIELQEVLAKLQSGFRLRVPASP